MHLGRKTLHRRSWNDYFDEMTILTLQRLQC